MAFWKRQTPAEKELQRREKRIKALQGLTKDLMNLQEKVLDAREKQEAPDPFLCHLNNNLSLLTKDLMVESSKMTQIGLDNVLRYVSNPN